LHYTDRCTDCNDFGRKFKTPVSGNVVVRGRIKNGEWVDQQPIWRMTIEQYTPMPDMAAADAWHSTARGTCSSVSE
jgi:hypothetical protein